MNIRLARAIMGIYNAIEESEPDISIERLLEMTAQAASKMPSAPRLGFDCGDVAEAIEMTEKERV